MPEPWMNPKSFGFAERDSFGVCVTLAPDFALQVVRRPGGSATVAWTATHAGERYGSQIEVREPCAADVALLLYHARSTLERLVGVAHAEAFARVVADLGTR